MSKPKKTPLEGAVETLAESVEKIEKRVSSLVVDDKPKPSPKPTSLAVEIDGVGYRFKYPQFQDGASKVAVADIIQDAERVQMIFMKYPSLFIKL